MGNTSECLSFSEKGGGRICLISLTASTNSPASGLLLFRWGYWQAFSQELPFSIQDLQASRRANGEHSTLRSQQDATRRPPSFPILSPCFRSGLPLRQVPHHRRFYCRRTQDQFDVPSRPILRRRLELVLRFRPSALPDLTLSFHCLTVLSNWFVSLFQFSRYR